MDQSNHYSAPHAAGSATPLTLDSDGWVTLTAGTTYLFPLGSRKSLNDAIHAQWDAALIATTIEVQETCMKSADVTDHAAQAGGNWLTINPTDAYVPASGGTATLAVVAVAGGTAGGALWSLPSDGAGRSRLEVTVGATGGEFRVGFNGVW